MMIEDKIKRYLNEEYSPNTNPTGEEDSKKKVWHRAVLDVLEAKMSYRIDKNKVQDFTYLVKGKELTIVDKNHGLGEDFHVIEETDLQGTNLTIEDVVKYLKERGAKKTANPTSRFGNLMGGDWISDKKKVSESADGEYYKKHWDKNKEFAVASGFARGTGGFWLIGIDTNHSCSPEFKTPQELKKWTKKNGFVIKGNPHNDRYKREGK